MDENAKMNILCNAIRQKKRVRFYYSAQRNDTNQTKRRIEPGIRVVEPHLLGTTRKGNLAIRAYYVTGETRSAIHSKWRLYRLDRMISKRGMKGIELLNETFHKRSGYSDTDKQLTTRCAIYGRTRTA